jgi:hypothetical protein
VSEGTLKTEDLLVSFWGAAEAAAKCRTPGLTFGGSHLTLNSALEKLVGEDSSETDWDDERASETLAELTDALQEYAPEGFSFGSQEGDGACFGFWITEDWAAALDHCGAETEDPEAAALLISELDAGGVTPENVEDAFQGEAEGYTEEEAGADFSAQLAKDTGAYDDSAAWPYCCIDWEEAWKLLEDDGFWLCRLSPARWLVFRSV